MLDKLSDLPGSIIDIILIRIPLGDAVRTSILSTKWRFHWTRIDSLMLDKDFFSDFHVPDVSSYLSIVGKIISLPIRKFSLHVPDFWAYAYPCMLCVTAYKHGYFGYHNDGFTVSNFSRKVMMIIHFRALCFDVQRTETFVIDGH